MKNGPASGALVVGALVFRVFSLLLIGTGAGDHAESYRTWIIAGAIVLGSGVVAQAVGGRGA